MRVSAVTAAALLLAGTGVARAVPTESDLTVTLSPNDTASIHIGIDDCASALDTDYTVSGTVKSTAVSGNYKLRLTWSTQDSACTPETLTECPSTASDGHCGCLAEVDNTTSVEDTIKIPDIVANACAATSNTRIKFFVQFRPEQSANTGTGTTTSTDTVTSASTDIDIDLSRPPTPTDVPSLSPADGAIVVTIGGVQSDDVAKYEICAQPVPADSADVDAGAADAGLLPTDAGVASGQVTNASLRLPFDSSDCHTIDKTQTSLRLDGLRNDTQYRIAYATMDASGNRSANSREARGTPSDVLDFAEYYSNVWHGGEKGGCQGVPASSSAPLGVLVAGALFALRRARRRSR